MRAFDLYFSCLAFTRTFCLVELLAARNLCTMIVLDAFSDFNAAGKCRSPPQSAPVVVDRAVDFTRPRPSSAAKRNPLGVLLLPLEPESWSQWFGCCRHICMRRPVWLLLISFVDVLVVLVERLPATPRPLELFGWYVGRRHLAVCSQTNAKRRRGF